MELNQAAIDLIAEFEGFVDRWYPDPAHGWKVPTCCYGHTDAAGEPKYAKTKDKRFTKAEGQEILRRDLRKYADAISSQVKVPLNPNQFGALVSWCYNVGPGATKSSTLIKKLNAGDYKSVPAQLARWNRAGGKVLAGLTRRRKAEADLFQTPYVAASAQKPIPAPVQPKAPDPAPTAPPESSKGIWPAIIEAFRKLAAKFGSK